MKITLLILTVALTTALATGQVMDNHSLHYLNDEAHPCLSADEYKAIELEISKNKALLGHKSQKTALSTSLIWPMRTSPSFADCDYYYISAFVDLDPTTGLKDWNCGTRTYNGHRGIDIVPWPFIWDKMDRDLVEVIAAAAGTIIAKVDGNPDRICNGVGGGGNSNNYITIEHADGSTALYVHMKSGSLTSKTIGQTVSAGEYLGIVGSAGQSTGVHLHFEVRTDGAFANYIDPFYGACNTTIGASWWAAQKPYTEPTIMKLSLHNKWPYMAVCPNTVDTTYEQDVFTPSAGMQATFHACTKHVSTNDVWNFRILNPDNTVFDSWNYTSLSNRNTSILGWSKTLPTTPGIYTFEGTFNAITCRKNFTIQPTVGIDNLSSNSAPIVVYPNPTNNQINFSVQTNLQLTNLAGQIIVERKNVTALDLSSQANGIYFLILSNNYGQVLQRVKIVKK